MVFQAYRSPLDVELSFKYLRRVLAALYDDWTVVVFNLRKAWRTWYWMSSVMV